MYSVLVSVEVIVRRDDRFLTIVRSDEEDFGRGWLSFTAGKLESGSAGMHALEKNGRRELMEEVGLDVAVADLFYVESHTFMMGNETVLDVVLMTDSAVGEARAVDPTEVADVLWLTPDEIMSDPRALEFTRESLRLAIASCTWNV